MSQRLSEWMAQAEEYLSHAQAAALEGEASLQECVLCVNEARKSVEGIESIIAAVQRLKVRTYAAREDARAAYEDAWGSHAQGGRVGFVEYATARERDASIDTKVLGEKVALRRAEKEHGLVMGVLDVLRTYSGMAEAIRKEAEFRVRAVQVLSSLER